MTLKYFLPAQNSFFSLVHMFVCLLNISCMSERHHKFNMAQSGGDSTHLPGPHPSGLPQVINSPTNYLGPTSRIYPSFPSFPHTYTKSVRISHQFYLLNI